MLMTETTQRSELDTEKSGSAHSSPALKTYVKMMRAVNTVTTRMHRHLSRYRLTVSQFGVLEALYHIGPMFQQEIGRRILKTSGNMTLVIDNLEKRGLVLRERVPEDRRYTQVRLTPGGRKLIQRLFPRHAKIAEQVFSVLNAEEIQTLGALLKKLGAASNREEDSSTNN
jgi:MarR family 2-MHQ and catechol resistance regulon transcriptional repressor